MPGIAYVPNVIKFGPGGLGGLLKLLSRHRSGTDIVPCESVEDLLLDPRSSRVRSCGFAYSSAALSDVCLYACPGLWRAVASVGRLSEKAPDRSHTARACGMFNLAVEDRFAEKLSDKNIVRDTTSSCYVGVLGPSYHYLCNYDLYEHLAPLAEDGGLEFFGACCVSRKVRLTFYWPGVCEEVSAGEGRPHRYHPGVSFFNDATGQAAAVRCGRVWVASGLGPAVAADKKPSRLAHTGGGFSTGLCKMAFSLCSPPAARDVASFGAAIRKMASTNLGLSYDSYEKRDGAYNKLVKMLGRFGFNRAVSDKAVLVACRKGASGELIKGPPIFAAQAARARTFYDLFFCLSAEVASMPVQRRDAFERLAFNFLAEFGYKT